MVVCFEVDGDSAANGACKGGIPSAEERDDEQHNSRKNSRKRDIMFDSRMRMVRRWNSKRGVMYETVTMKVAKNKKTEIYPASPPIQTRHLQYVS